MGSEIELRRLRSSIDELVKATNKIARAVSDQNAHLAAIAKAFSKDSITPTKDMNPVDLTPDPNLAQEI